MPDREKVIKSLKWFRDRDSWREGIMIHDDHAEVRKQICDNALALLKVQEPVEPELEGGGRSWWYVCCECHTAIDTKDTYCRECGRKIKWGN